VREREGGERERVDISHSAVCYLKNCVFFFQIYVFLVLYRQKQLQKNVTFAEKLAVSARPGLGQYTAH
jgi:hypothetical protein